MTMNSLRFRWASVLVLLISLALGNLSGCGGSKEIPSDVPETAGLPGARDALQDLAELLKRLSAGGINPPSNDAEFADYDVEHPAAATLIANRAIVYCYGAIIDTNGNGSKWIAMQSNAKESGGWVLLDNGELRDMPAADIAKLKPVKEIK